MSGKSVALPRSSVVTPQRRRFFRPGVERLEDRLTPSTLLPGFSETQRFSGSWTNQLPIDPLPGLKAEFFDYTSSLSRVPDLSGRTADVVRTDSQINYASTSSAWSGLGSNFADTFASRHTGFLRIPTAGSYTFYLNSDDGSKLWIDGLLVISNDGLHSLRELSATRTLTAGHHSLRVEFFENTATAGLILSWTSPGGSKEVIPANVLFQTLPAFQQDSGPDGLVVMEAENHDANVSQGGKSWTPYSVAGYSGTGALQATPNTGALINTGYVTTSPRLDFRVHFTKTGTHYVWVRGRGPNGDDDSIHVGLDDQAVASADRISSFATIYGWTRSTIDGMVATLDVTTPGLHTVNVWMREDGTVVDKLLLTTDASFTPTGLGPAESLRVGSPAPAFQQDSGPDGLVVMEVENHDANVSQGGKSWTPYSVAGYSGTGALQATPNTGSLINTGYVTTSPRLDFRVHFTKTGTHYVWVRGRGPNGDDDSIHVGLDGHAVASADRISGFLPNYSWTRNTMDGLVATLDVTTLGLHTVNVWMREDGTVVDKLLLTTDASFTPTGLGPGESPRAGFLVLTRGPGGGEDFEEGSDTTTADNFLSGNPGTLVGDPMLVAERRGNALQFDGGEDDVSLANGLQQFLSAAATEAFWSQTLLTNSTTKGPAPGILGAESAGDGNDLFWDWIEALGQIVLKAGDEERGPDRNS